MRQRCWPDILGGSWDARRFVIERREPRDCGSRRSSSRAATSRLGVALCWLVATAALATANPACQGGSSEPLSRAAQDPPPRSASSKTPVTTAEPDPRPSLPPEERTWTFGETKFGRIDVVIRVPERAPEAKFPALIAFHGRGESLKGSRRGARGWLDDYELERSIQRLKAPPLDEEAFEGFVSPERLSTINAELDRQPFEELVVVMPYLPDALKRDQAFDNGPILADFVAKELLPRMRKELPVVAASAAVGIDGVSLGGRAALLVGFAHPTAFGTLGATQAAVDQQELSRWQQLAARAIAENPRLELRLLTSEDDYYRAVLTTFASRLKAGGIPHRFDVVAGNHSYEFNRGPGGIEMLLFHSRTLARP